MCRNDGTSKNFQTEIRELAEIKAKKEEKRLGKPIYVYFCSHCSSFCITSQRRNSTRPKQKRNSKQRRKIALRPQICDWESEGGSFGE